MTKYTAQIFLILLSVLVLIPCTTKGFLINQSISNSGISFFNITQKFSSDSAAISVSSDCSRQLSHLIYNHEEALFKMADAWSKFPYEGLLYASRTDYGDYDECISVKVQTEASETILGKHCTYGLIIPDVTVKNTTEMFERGWKLSYCIPHLCSAEDLKNITKLPIFNDAVCSTQESNTHLDTGAKITMGIFIIFASLIILSTIYDLSFYKSKDGNFIFAAFSIHANGKRLFTFSRHSSEQILCFHGIKFVSMWWIMSGHSAVAWTALPVMNDDWRTKWQTLNYSQYIMTAHLAVDSFFYISGFLLSYLYFKNELSKQDLLVQLKAVPSMVLHRYLRLTPAVLTVFLFVVYLYRYTGDGPVFSYRVNGALTEPCRNYWWAVFLYIQNYYIFHLGEELCITPLWYISADMQLFLIAPLIIIPIALLHKRSFKMALAVLFGLNIFFIAVPIFTKLIWRAYDPEFAEYDAHSRLTDYFIGVMMGVYMGHEKVKNVRINKISNIIIWTVILATMLGVVMVTQEINLNYGYVSKALCYSISRPTWCICLCWITYACFTGHGGFVNWLLSNKFMQFGGKLTYCLYLVHGPVITHYALIAKNRRIFSDYHMFYDWAGHFIVSMLIGIFWTLAFELPMITIEKYIFGYRINKTGQNRNK